MKNTFSEYYILSDEERIKGIWNDAIIILDANVLLNLYRYSDETRDNLFNVLEYYKNRLWIPYQVGLEYHQNRIAVYQDMNAAYDQIIASLDKETKEFIKKLNLSKYSRHPRIEIKWFEDQIIACASELQDKLKYMKDSSPDYSAKDEINERIANLFDGRVGNDFEDSTLNELYKEGQRRYNEKIPPGYCDAKDKKDRDNRHLYGDLIWWKQVIKEASEKKCNVILVTDDVKEDWFERVKGITIGPRKELLKEFHTNTQMDILIYPTHTFLEYAKVNIPVSVNQETISETNEIHKENEAIVDCISSFPDDKENEVLKMFSDNPWMSAESFSRTYLNSIVGIGVTSKYSDILRKTSVNPSNRIADIKPDYSSVTGNSLLHPNLGPAPSLYSDMLGKRPLNPSDSIAGIKPDYLSVTGKSLLHPNLEPAPSLYSDMLGKRPLNPSDGIAGIKPYYPSVTGKSLLHPNLEPATSLYSDMLGKRPLNPSDGIAGIKSDYLSVTGKSLLYPNLEPATSLYSDMLGKRPLNPADGIAGIKPDYLSVTGKSLLHPNLEPAPSLYSDMLGKRPLNPADGIAGIKPYYQSVTGNSLLHPNLEPASFIYSDIPGKRPVNPLDDFIKGSLIFSDASNRSIWDLPKKSPTISSIIKMNHPVNNGEKNQNTNKS